MWRGYFAGEKQQLATLAANDFFGETSLVDDEEASPEPQDILEHR